MKKLIGALVASIVLATAAVPADAAQARVQVGRLSCNVQGGVGLILGSSKSMTCVFHRDGHRNETYHGTINKLGLDIGVTRRTRIEWLVFAATNTQLRSRALAGNYVGGSGEATVGVGVGANWLIGGSRRGFALQPLSVQAQTGLNVSLALAGLTLR
jgi:hypothetical protein